MRRNRHDSPTPSAPDPSARPVRTGRRRGLAVGGVLALTLTGLAAAGTASADDRAQPRTVPLQILSFNDLHGYLDPPTGSDGNVPTAAGAVPAGGMAYLASHLKSLRAGQPHSVTVSAGDLIGASPFTSAAFKDEPTVEALNALKLDVSAVGNHELDEGVAELLRMQYGGCHPVQGCFDPNGYRGARYHYLAANVTYKPGTKADRPARSDDYGAWFGSRTGRTILPPTWVKEVGDVKVGFIGLTLHSADELVAQAGIRDIEFRDEIATANLAAADLGRRGVKAIVLLLHQGGLAPAAATYDFPCNPGGGPATISGDVVDLAKRLDPGIDLIVSGHSHQSYICDIKDPAGNDRYVTSASSYGKLITATQLQLDRRTRDVVRSSVTSANHVVTRDVTPDAAQAARTATWTERAAPIGNRVVGSITADIRARGKIRDVETPLGDLIADAQLEATAAPVDGGSAIALMNPGGVRADLTYAGSTAGEGDGKVTYSEAAAVQPFGNLLVSMDLTGAQLEKVLEQQWTPQSDGTVRFLHLAVSKGLAYAWSAGAPPGDKIDPASIMLNGTAVDPAATYRVTVNSFLADGGDGFLELRNGTNRLGGGVDLDAFTAYLGAHAPVAPPAADRVTRLT
ncbi:MAG TPA: bifunctional metallophosphatase/5'-nucleotidase [Kineosporiaceae bacterium]|nr:bifunctional metallophosphatase/5'-nucleotidase [Kineosporiaceae bacterium]